ncbi:MAG: tyrosine-type recombinase/integrase [Deltaproteobacteria bacterium]|nr:tyrosine-type recombinase/integrase [Deltaproteobacteria bacterium]
MCSVLPIAPSTYHEQKARQADPSRLPERAVRDAEPRNVERVWGRVRRRATKKGVRPLPLHSARHSWATWALQAGKNIRWVADQLGHADASTTLNHYAHAMREDDEDLSFLILDGTGRHNTAHGGDAEDREAAKYANQMGNMARPARLERATLSSAS